MTTTETLPGNGKEITKLMMRKDRDITSVSPGGKYYSFSTVALIAAGYRGVLTLTSSGGVSAYGWVNAVPDPLEPLKFITKGEGSSSHVLGIKADNTVLGWGTNNYGEINIPVGLTDVIKVGAGNRYSAALKSDGTIVGWGQIAAPVVTTAIDIDVGKIHAIALLADGSTVTWGNTSDGRGTIKTGLKKAICSTACSIAILRRVKSSFNTLLRILLRNYVLLRSI